MALDTHPKPYGLSDIKITSIDGVTQVDLPAVTKLTFKERIKAAEGPGDDKLSTVVAVRDAIEWELEATGLPLEALAVMYGTTTSTSGSTPNQIKTLNQAGAVRLPYFKIYGKSLGEGDDDIHCIIYKAKVTEGIDGAMQYGELFKPVIKGLAIDDDVNGIYDWVQNETAADLPGETASAPSFTLSSVPADAATGVVVSSNIVLTFSNALAHGAEAGIILTTDAGVPKACARTLDGTRKVVTLNPSTDMAGTTDYLIIVPGVRDVYGQTLADTVINFTTGS
jgi:hypothetical protein